MLASRPSGMKAFLMVWVGQVFSMIGSAIAQFALSIWAWQQTGQATPLAMVAFFGFFPLIVITPFAGVLVDRWDRKFVMAISDLLAACATAFILVFSLFSRLEIWHLYAASVLYGVGGAFQWPAYSAAISLMVPKNQYGRASAQ